MVRRGRQPLELGIDGGIARAQLRLAHVEEFEVLLEDKEVFGLVVARQGGHDVFEGRLAMGVAVLGEDVRIPLAGDEGAEDLEAGLADNVAHDAREQEVHLDQGLLHPLDIGPGRLDKHVAVAHEGAQGEDGPGGAKAPAQEAHRVELAEPLTVLDVTFAARDILDVARIDQQDLKAASLEDVVDRDPVDAGGFHGDAGHATGHEPIGEAVEVRGEGPEGPHRRGVPVGWDGDVVLGGAAVEAGDIDLNTVEHGG